MRTRSRESLNMRETRAHESETDVGGAARRANSALYQRGEEVIARVDLLTE